MEESKLILRQLVEGDEAAFLAGLAEWKEEDRSWHTFEWKNGMAFADHLSRLDKNTRGEEIKETWVPSTMLYGFVDDVIVGRMSIRHTLNEHLRTYGGHIGYAVAEKYRRNGYASSMMRQTLPICSALGLKKVLATCDANNDPSIKIIEKFGGKLEDTFWDDKVKRYTCRYWIDIQ